MKVIGLLGGMSWESTASYYQLINEGVNRQLGGLHSAKICLYSVDFAEIEKLQCNDSWVESGKLLAEAAKSLEAAGADFLLLCTNTMHKVSPDIVSKISIPFLHIADATAEQLTADGVRRIGLLGTKFTMEQTFYKNRISDTFGIEVIIPNQDQRDLVHKVIYEELCLGRISEVSKQQFIEIITALGEAGAEAVILGCTEIGLLVSQADVQVPLYDTTVIHAAKAVERALSTATSN